MEFHFPTLQAPLSPIKLQALLDQYRKEQNMCQTAQNDSGSSESDTELHVDQSEDII